MDGWELIGCAVTIYLEHWRSGGREKVLVHPLLPPPPLPVMDLTLISLSAWSRWKGDCLLASCPRAPPGGH